MSFGWRLRDYVKRVWDNSGEDNVLFLAGGIAFNLLLAAVPFILLLAAGITFLLPLFMRGVDVTAGVDPVTQFIDRLLPAHGHSDNSQLDKLIGGLLTKRSSVTLYSAIGFVWFSTRLFGSLRTVLASVFDIESERGIIAGKIFDVKITVYSTLLFVANVLVSGYILIGTKLGAARFAIGSAALSRLFAPELKSVPWYAWMGGFYGAFFVTCLPVTWRISSASRSSARRPGRPRRKCSRALSNTAQ